MVGIFIHVPLNNSILFQFYKSFVYIRNAFTSLSTLLSVEPEAINSRLLPFLTQDGIGDLGLLLTLAIGLVLKTEITLRSRENAFC